jgi:transcriptional regulator with XRE-family HTH domain
MFLTENKMDHVDLVEAGMNQREWLPADLARKSGKSRAVISKLLNRTGDPTPATLIAVAKVLNISEEEILRAAGILSPKPETDEAIEHGKHTLENYKRPETKERALEYLEFLKLQEEQGNHDTKPDQKKKHKNNESLPRLSTLK